MTVKAADTAIIPGGDFAALTAEWATITKSMAATDSGTEGGDGDLDADGKPKVAAEGGGDGDDGDAMFGKSFTVALPDGKEVEAYDGTAMMKALHDQNVVLNGKVNQMSADNGALVKAFTTATTVIKAQGEMIKSLQADVARIGTTGTGRRAILTVAEKVTPTATEKPGITPQEFMAKAMTAFHAGKINGHDVAILDSRLHRNVDLPDDLVKTVLAH